MSDDRLAAVESELQRMSGRLNLMEADILELQQRPVPPSRQEMADFLLEVHEFNKRIQNLIERMRS